MKEKRKEPSLFQALIPIIILIILLALNVYFYKDDTLSGASQMALLFAASVAGIIAWRNKIGWKTISTKIMASIGTAMPSILILLLIGSLAGTWLISGVIPTLIYYGIQILHPSIFLFAAVVISAIVSVATGSSWSTIATIGIALLGIGNALNIRVEIVAGAIISGAYFGDKISPLSDTTNLAPAMTGTDLFTHIRYMLYTTIPSMIITLLIFLGIGLFSVNPVEKVQIGQVMNTINKTFHVNPLLLIVPIALITSIIKKVPPIPSLLIGTLLGGIFAIIFQPGIVNEVANIPGNYLQSSYLAVMQSMFGKVQIVTDNEKINNLFSTNGMAGMLDTVWLILTAMVFGGVMEAGGLLRRITHSIINLANSTGSLVSSTVATCILFNATASDQYLSIVVPGRMFSEVYKKRGFKPELLSRTLEDGGTVTSVLVPWNTGGATQARVLGVSTWAYFPYCFFNIISPFMSVLFAYLNIRIRRTEKEQE
ncbi:Na+/H+ antiporter NhaC [Bacteroidota bacterium]